MLLVPPVLELDEVVVEVAASKVLALRGVACGEQRSFCKEWHV